LSRKKIDKVASMKITEKNHPNSFGECEKIESFTGLMMTKVIYLELKEEYYAYLTHGIDSLDVAAT
jgi:hypothetical protein